MIRQHITPARLMLLAVLLSVVVLVYWWRSGIANEGGNIASVQVKRGNLEIRVLEGGSIQALDSLEMKSEVQGTSKILSIIEEGFQITPKDVEDGLVLAELDTKELLDQQTNQELSYQNARASFTEAKEQYDIQMNQNESDIKAASLMVKFAKMDLQKFLGAEVADEIVAIVDKELALKDGGETTGAAGESETTEKVSSVTDEGMDPDIALMLNAMAEETNPVDFTDYADPGKLGDGEALQQLRKIENDVILSNEEVGLAQTQLEGTQRLYEKDFVTKNDLENDTLALKRQSIEKESYETDLDLYIQYTFPKQAEKLLSDYQEAMRALERQKKQALSKLAQLEAKFLSSKAQFELQSRKREEIREQIEKCIIKAVKPGLVVYGKSDRGRYDNEVIEEGATVRERQVIFTIPDLSGMAINVAVHESAIQQVQKGQRARIRIDAFPNEVLYGTVHKIAVLPDSQNRWLNPDLKVYTTAIAIEGQYDWIKPGLSAEAEIIVDTLEDVLYVPVQAVFEERGETVSYVSSLTGSNRSNVKIGKFNDLYVEVKEGLEEGDYVLLRQPVAPSTKDKQPEEDTPAADPIPEPAHG